MIGNTVIIVILIPLLFQLVMLSTKMEKGHREIQERLARIEQKLGR